MRHGDKINNLSRTKGHRTALMRGLACQLIDHKRIVTTLAKAKALRVYVEPLITKSKDNTTHQRRLVFGALNDKKAVTELFSIVSPKVAGRPGGYTRIIKLGRRVGDAGELAMIELVDFNDVYGKGKEDASAPRRRTRRGGKSAKTGEEQTTEVADKEEKTTAEATTAEKPVAEKKDTPEKKEKSDDSEQAAS